MQHLNGSSSDKLLAIAVHVAFPIPPLLHNLLQPNKPQSTSGFSLRSSGLKAQTTNGHWNSAHDDLPRRAQKRRVAEARYRTPSRALVLQELAAEQLKFNLHPLPLSRRYPRVTPRNQARLPERAPMANSKLFRPARCEFGQWPFSQLIR